MTTNDRTSKLPAGWLATAIGGAAGAVMGAMLLFAAATAYLDRMSNEGLEGLFQALLAGAIGAFLGGAAGAAGLLRALGHTRPVASGLAFSSIVLLLMGALALVMNAVYPEMDEGLNLVVVLTVSPLIAALGTRALLERFTASSSGDIHRND